MGSKEMDSKEQELVNLCYSLVLVSTSDKVFCKKSNEEKAEWVREHLNAMGFPTIPMGARWGYLTTPEMFNDYKAHMDKGDG